MNQNNLKAFLTPNLCEDAGIIVNNVTDSSIEIGAMNPDYGKVKEVIERIKSEYQLKVDITQITSMEWERSFQDQLLQSLESNQINLDNSPTQSYKQTVNQVPNISELKNETFLYNDPHPFNVATKSDSEQSNNESNIQERNPDKSEPSNILIEII